MLRVIWKFIQLAILVAIGILVLNYSYPISIVFDEIILSTSSTYIVFLVLFVIFLAIFIQSILFFIRRRVFKIKFDIRKNNYEKGYEAFTRGMVAIANKDFKKAVLENNKVSYYIKDKSLNLLLKSETLKIEKKFTELENVYDEMLKNENTKILGLKGLMKHNLYAQDYHHAFIYGEKLFNINHSIEKLYETLVKIISKTNNWHKLIEITEKALKFKLIDKKDFSTNKSIAYYEISKIKRYSEPKESISLIEKALKLRQYFPPYVCHYVELLIRDNQLNKAKKYLQKSWSHFTHPDYKKLIEILSQKMKISHLNFASFVIEGSKNKSESHVLMAEVFIQDKNWIEARKYLLPYLEHKPSREVCMLMSIIEKEENNDPQKANAWISRSNFGDINNIWICSITNISQEKWSSVSSAGYFNSLVWKKPQQLTELQSSDIESNIIKYINN